MVDDTVAHSIEEAIEHDIERLLHPTGTTGPAAAPAPVATAVPGSVPAPTVSIAAVAPAPGVPLTPAVTGTTGTTGPALTDAERALGARFGFDSHGRPHVPPPEPTSSGGTGAQTGSQHQIFNKG